MKNLMLLVAITCFFSCYNDHLKEPSYCEELETRFNNEILPILNDKCFNCHNYHQSGDSYFNTINKFRPISNTIKNRLGQTGLLAMPPSSLDQLENTELEAILQFIDQSCATETDVPSQLFNVKWTAYKYPIFENRAAVSGGFNEIMMEGNYNEDDTLLKIVDEAKITIPLEGAYVDNNPLATSNIIEHFFSYLGNNIFVASKSVSEEKVVFNITINSITMEVPFTISNFDTYTKLNGTIQDLHFFNTDDAFSTLNVVAGEYHQNTVWPDVDIEITIFSMM